MFKTSIFSKYVAVLREKIFSKKFHHIITDALILLVIGIVLVIVAGIIEAGVF